MTRGCIVRSASSRWSLGLKINEKKRFAKKGSDQSLGLKLHQRYFKVKKKKTKSFNARIFFQVASNEERIEVCSRVTRVSPRHYLLPFQVAFSMTFLARFAGIIPRGSITVYSRATGAPGSSSGPSGEIVSTCVRRSPRAVAWWTKRIEINVEPAD